MRALFEVAGSGQAPASDARASWTPALSPAIAIALLCCSTGTSWADERIGGAEIVINEVQGDLTSGPIVVVVQGDGVYRDEGIRTRAESKARLRLDDKSAVTIGPSSKIKLDRFVYSGPKQTGTIVLNLAKGTCRIVIGDANRRAYTILTPTAAIGVRE